MMVREAERDRGGQWGGEEHWSQKSTCTGRSLRDCVEANSKRSNKRPGKFADLLTGCEGPNIKITSEFCKGDEPAEAHPSILALCSPGFVGS